jgi:hypothetical protein
MSCGERISCPPMSDEVSFRMTEQSARRYSPVVSDRPKPTTERKRTVETSKDNPLNKVVSSVRVSLAFVMNLVTTAEVKTGMALYALPGIPSYPAQRMIDPSVPDHPSASAPTRRAGFTRSGRRTSKPCRNVRKDTINQGS